MSLELKVRFTSPDRFAIKFDDRKTDALEFKAPVNDGDRDMQHNQNEAQFLIARRLLLLGDRRSPSWNFPKCFGNFIETMKEFLMERWN
jgi:hypothetical protein